MAGLAAKSLAVGAACLCLAGCMTEREHVVAPDAQGVVIDATTGQPVEGARVRFSGLDGAQPVITGADGRFTLSGRTETRTIIALPVSGVFRDSVQIQASVSGRTDGYGTAAFINGLGPAEAENSVVVLVFSPDADEVPLHALTRDCADTPEQHHAMQLAAHLAGIGPDSPRGWLDADGAEALHEHLRLTLPASFFRSCEQMNEAYDLYTAQTAALRAFQGAAPHTPVD